LGRTLPSDGGKTGGHSSFFEFVVPEFRETLSMPLHEVALYAVAPATACRGKLPPVIEILKQIIVWPRTQKGAKTSSIW
jgi:hypothetical protein